MKYNAGHGRFPPPIQARAGSDPRSPGAPRHHDPAARSRRTDCWTRRTGRPMPCATASPTTASRLPGASCRFAPGAAGRTWARSPARGARAAAARAGRGDFRPGHISLVLGLFMLAWAVDGLNSFLALLELPHLYPPSNLLRLATGALEGITIAAILLPALSVSLWRAPADARSIAEQARPAVAPAGGRLRLRGRRARAGTGCCIRLPCSADWRCRCCWVRSTRCSTWRSGAGKARRRGGGRWLRRCSWAWRWR